MSHCRFALDRVEDAGRFGNFWHWICFPSQFGLMCAVCSAHVLPAGLHIECDARETVNCDGCLGDSVRLEYQIVRLYLILIIIEWPLTWWWWIGILQSHFDWVKCGANKLMIDNQLIFNFDYFHLQGWELALPLVPPSLHWIITSSINVDRVRRKWNCFNQFKSIIFKFICFSGWIVNGRNSCGDVSSAATHSFVVGSIRFQWRYSGHFWFGTARRIRIDIVAAGQMVISISIFNFFRKFIIQFRIIRHLKEEIIDVELAQYTEPMETVKEDENDDLPEMKTLIFANPPKLRKNFSDVAISSMNRGMPKRPTFPRIMSNGGSIATSGPLGLNDLSSAVKRRKASVMSQLSTLDFMGSNLLVHVNVSASHGPPSRTNRI